MSNQTFSLELHCRIYDDDNGHYLTVRPDADGLECVQLCTDDSEKEYWGDLRLVMPPAMARKLAEALIKVVDSLKDPA